MSKKEGMFLRVPHELLGSIFSFLDYESYFHTSLVCKTLYQISEDHRGWEHLYRRRWPNLMNKSNLDSVKELPNSKRRKFDFKSMCHCRYSVYRNWFKRRYKKVEFDKRIGGPVGCLIFDNRKVISGDYYGNIQLYDISSGRAFQTKRHYHNGAIKCMVTDQNGDVLVTGGSDGCTRVMDLATGAEIRNLTGTGTISCLCFNTDYSLIINVNDSGCVQAWDVRSGKREISINDPFGSSNYVYLRISGISSSVVESISVDSTLSQWDLKKAMISDAISFFKGFIECAQCDDGVLVAGSCDRLIKIYDRRTGDVKLMQGHAGSIFGLGFDRNLIVTGASDGTVKVWDFETRKNVSTLSGFGNSVQCVSFSESKLIAGDLNGAIKVFDFDPKGILNTL